MTFLPSCFTSSRLETMAAVLHIELCGISGKEALSLQESQEVLAGTLGFGRWSDVLSAAASQDFFSEANTLSHLGLAWLAIPENRRLFWGAVGHQMDMCVAIFDALKILPAELIKTGAPPQIQEVMDRMRDEMLRRNRIPFAMLAAVFSRLEAVDMEVASKLSTLSETLREMSLAP